MTEVFENGDKLLVNFNRVSSIREQVGYWRKANQIHKWFVDYCQDGVDECQETFVSVETLKTLMAVVTDVLENKGKAQGLLPVESGFFFGSTEYDEYYWEDLEYTRKMLEEILAEDNTNASFYYQSSW